MLFIDLVKAFDRALRKIVIGWPRGNIDDWIGYLTQLGLDHDSAKVVHVDLLQNGCIMERLQAHPHIVTLMASLHTSSWFKSDPDSNDVMVVRKGGRQGCLFGAKIFNMGYAKALQEIADVLLAENVHLRIHYNPAAPVWSPSCGAPLAAADVVDITFVDDEAMMITACSPRQLQKSVNLLLSALQTTFDKYKMTVNWSKGKTEALMCYRGKHAKQCKTNLVLDDGSSGYSLPPCVKEATGKSHLVVSQSYKHLGGYITVSGNLVVEARHRASSAMSSFVPIAQKVFGCSSMSLQHKLQLGWSLIVSKLVYNFHTWSYFSGVARTTLNVVYMRLWRRIANSPRFNREALSDLTVRRGLGVPSIDCYIRRRRLAYLDRLHKCDVLPLQALLRQKTPDQTPLPWVRLVTMDLHVIQENLPEKLGAMPRPSDNPGIWLDLICNYSSQWKELVSLYYSCFSDVNETANAADHASGSQIASALTFTCDICSNRASFLTEKQLLAHKRAKHGVRNKIVELLDDISTCPICACEFHSRLRLMRHLSETRIRSKHSKTNCRFEFLSTERIPIDPAMAVTLNEKDRICRRTARKSGHSHVIATKLAVISKYARPQKQVKSGALA